MHFAPKYSPDPTARLWLWWMDFIVNEFIQKDIKIPDDRLPAISGLATEFAKQTGFHYKCGLWEEDILSCLRWNAHGTKRHVHYSTNPPSWSWASVEGFQSKLGHDFCCYNKHIHGFDAHIVEVAFENVDQNIYGQVKSATLVVEARWHYLRSIPPSRIYMLLDYYQWHKAQGIPSQYTPAQRKIICSLDTAPRSEPKIHSEAVFIQLGKWEGSYVRSKSYSREYGIIFALILEPVEGEQDIFRRIGIAEIPEDYPAEEWATNRFAII
jgi:hypothetical protein